MSKTLFNIRIDGEAWHPLLAKRLIFRQIGPNCLKIGQWSLECPLRAGEKGLKVEA